MSAIAQISDLLVVQKNWMYLANIFLGNESIKNLLRDEYDLFMTVHKGFGNRTK